MRHTVKPPREVLFTWLGVAALLAAGCSVDTGGTGAVPLPEPGAARPDPPALRVVRSMGDAFNRHDVESLISHTTPDVEWLSIDGASVAVETQGHEALRESMTGYFQALPSVRSEIEDTLVAGAFVTVTERAHWTDREGQPRSQAALAVYEVRGDLVRRVWYFPASQ